MAQAINPFDRTCDRCGGTIRRDERMEYRMNPGRGVWHPVCPSAKAAPAAASVASPAPAPRQARAFSNSWTPAPGATGLNALDARFLDREDY